MGPDLYSVNQGFKTLKLYCTSPLFLSPPFVTTPLESRLSPCLRETLSGSGYSLWVRDRRLRKASSVPFSRVLVSSLPLPSVLLPAWWSRFGPGRRGSGARTFAVTTRIPFGPFPLRHIFFVGATAQKRPFYGLLSLTAWRLGVPVGVTWPYRRHEYIFNPRETVCGFPLFQG